MIKKPTNEPNIEQDDDLKEWVIWSFGLSVLAVLISALTWIFKK